jgi:hypothetical protein
MDRPQRVQLKRLKGWRMPENTVKVTRPGPWGNPFVIGDEGIPDAAEAVRRYREWWKLLPRMQPGMRLWVLNHRLPELRGKNLACWCKPGEPCHADVLLEIANA